MVAVAPQPGVGARDQSTSTGRLATTRKDLFCTAASASVFLIPVQIEAGLPTRVSPTDIFVCLALAIGSNRIKLVSGSGLLGPFALPLGMLYGVVVGALTVGTISVPGIVVKAFGAVLLVGSLLLWQQLARESPDGPLQLIRTFLAGSITFTAIALVENAAGTSFVAVRFIESRFSGTFYDPNHYGNLTACGLILLAACHKELGVRKSTIALGGLVLSTGLVLSASRGAWLVTAVGLGVVALLVRPRIRPRHVVAAIVTASGLAGSGVVAKVLSNIASRPDNVGHRGSLIAKGIESLESSHYVGIGLSSFVETHGIIIHNSFFWMAVEFGLVGALLYCLFVGGTAIRLLRMPKTRVVVGAFAAHIALTVASMNVEAMYQRQWWLILALVVAVSAHSIQNRPCQQLRTVTTAPGLQSM